MKFAAMIRVNPCTPVLLFVVLSMIRAMVACGAAQPTSAVVPVFDEAAIEHDPQVADGTARNGYIVFRNGQMLQRHLELPPAPSKQRDAQRIIATLILEPVIQEEQGKLRPGDPWTRLGTVTLVVRPASPPSTPPPSTTDAPQPDAQPTASPQAPQTTGEPAAATTATPTATQANPQPTAETEVELMRFITGFGGYGTFTQDVTDLAPLLHGNATIRVFISTYKKPAWKVTLTLTYTGESPGYRRPVWVAPVFDEHSITAERHKVSSTIEVPAGLARPRLRIMSTGHATDGTGGDEFISRTHILRIDGIEIARWRPWSEDSGVTHEANPMSGRVNLDGRELWSSDLDRSGWRPGTLVTPMRIPVAELTPGTHTIELEIVNIRPKDQLQHHGYWRVSCVAVADEPWPEQPGASP